MHLEGFWETTAQEKQSQPGTCVLTDTRSHKKLPTSVCFAYVLAALGRQSPSPQALVMCCRASQHSQPGHLLTHAGHHRQSPRAATVSTQLHGMDEIHTFRSHQGHNCLKARVSSHRWEASGQVSRVLFNNSDMGESQSLLQLTNRPWPHPLRPLLKSHFCRLGCPRNCCVNQAGLKLRDPPAFASQCFTTTSYQPCLIFILKQELTEDLGWP